jgi:hypothetical protein
MKTKRNKIIKSYERTNKPKRTKKPKRTNKPKRTKRTKRTKRKLISKSGGSPLAIGIGGGIALIIFLYLVKYWNKLTKSEKISAQEALDQGANSELWDGLHARAQEIEEAEERRDDSFHGLNISLPPLPEQEQEQESEQELESPPASPVSSPKPFILLEDKPEDKPEPISIRPTVPEYRPQHTRMVKPTQPKMSPKRAEERAERIRNASKRKLSNFEAATMAKSTAIKQKIQDDKNRVKPKLGAIGETPNKPSPGRRTSPIHDKFKGKRGGIRRRRKTRTKGKKITKRKKNKK